MKTIKTAILATLAGVLAGAITTGTSASADEEGFSPDRIHTECDLRTDTNCIVWLHGHPTAEGPVQVRFVDDGQFCIITRPPIGNKIRCENYWPFKRPVINASSK